MGDPRSDGVTYTWRRRQSVLLADDEPVGELRAGWKTPDADLVAGGESWRFAWTSARRREALHGERTLIVATNTSMVTDRWRFEGAVVGTAKPRRPLSRTIDVRDEDGALLADIGQPLVGLTAGVRLRARQPLPVAHAAFLLWVLQADARTRFNLGDVIAGG